MACLAKRRGKWIVDYRIGGKRCTPSFSTKGEAEVFLRDLRLRRIDQITGYAPMIEKLLSIAVKEYLNSVTPKKSARTSEIDTLALNELSNSFSRALVQDISGQEIESYQAQLLKKYQPATVNRRFNVIRNFFRKCVHWKYIETSPTEGLKRIPEPPVEKEVMTPEEITKTLNSIPEWAHDPLFLVSLTGVRRTEAITLEWKNVDLGKRTISFFSKKGGVQRRREIPMSQSIFDMVMTRWNDRQQSAIRSQYVFLGPKNLPINPRTFSSAVCKNGRKAGVKKSGIQILRRTLLTDMSENNQSGSVIQKIAGHSHLGTTQRYLQHNNDALRSSLEQVEYQRIKIVSRNRGS